MARKSVGPVFRAECRCGQLHTRNDLLDWTPFKCSCGNEIKFPHPHRSFAEIILPPSQRKEPYSVLPTIEETVEPFRHIELKCQFIELDGWLVDLAKVMHAHIDSGHITLAQLNGVSLIFENSESAADLVPGANQLEPFKFKALAEYLKDRFNAEKVLTPTDEALGGDSKD